MNHVDIVLGSYNYILSSSIRKSMGINVENVIIVFDEGHNLDSVAESIFSATAKWDKYAC